MTNWYNDYDSETLRSLLVDDNELLNQLGYLDNEIINFSDKEKTSIIFDAQSDIESLIEEREEEDHEEEMAEDLNNASLSSDPDDLKNISVGDYRLDPKRSEAVLEKLDEHGFNRNDDEIIGKAITEVFPSSIECYFDVINDKQIWIFYGGNIFGKYTLYKFSFMEDKYEYLRKDMIIRALKKIVEVIEFSTEYEVKSYFENEILEGNLTERCCEFEDLPFMKDENSQKRK